VQVQSNLFFGEDSFQQHPEQHEVSGQICVSTCKDSAICHDGRAETNNPASHGLQLSDALKGLIETVIEHSCYLGHHFPDSQWIRPAAN
jgi:hypothetical protein